MNVVATTSMITTALGRGMMGRRGGAGIEGIISGGMGRGGWDGCSIRIFSFLFFQPLGFFFGVDYACVRAFCKGSVYGAVLTENELTTIRYE